MTFWDVVNQGFIGYYLIGGTDERTGIALIILSFILCIASGYLLGSINSAIIISKMRYGGDIRSSGSGNAGTTNVLRTYGKAPAAMTLGGDALKTLLAYIAGTLVFGIRGAYLSCFMCVLGHVFPIFYRFRGGKGIVCAAVMILLLNPPAFLILLVIFIIVLVSFKYVSLASIMVAMLYPIVHTWTLTMGKFMISRLWLGSTAFAVLTAVLVLWRHYPNMKRLWDRTESKIDLKGLISKSKKDAATEKSDKTKETENAEKARSDKSGDEK